MAVSMSAEAALCLVLVSFMSVLVHLESYAAVAPEWTEDPKVNLTLYYESLCPGSADFITNDLVKAVRTPDVERVINLQLVPWGNAHLDNSTETVVCQHGEKECYLNTIHACAIESWPDQKTHFEFINCVEIGALMEHGSGSEEITWKTCCKRLKLDPSPISKCYSSGLGKKLELQYGVETDRLSPPHEYVPWVVVNGRPINEDYPNFMYYICLYYKGPTPPAGCNNITIPSSGRNNQTC